MQGDQRQTWSTTGTSGSWRGTTFYNNAFVWPREQSDDNAVIDDILARSGLPPLTTPLTPAQKKERELDEREAALTKREREIANREQRVSAREGAVANREYEIAQARKTAPSGPWALFHLAPGAPLEVVEAVYRALSRKYHPDANPNDPTALPKMQAINAAIDHIRREAGRG